MRSTASRSPTPSQPGSRPPRQRLRGTPWAAPWRRGSSPNHLRAALLDGARQAFTQELQLTAAIGAAVAVGFAILAATLLPHAGTDGEPEAQADPGPIDAEEAAQLTRA